MDSGSFEGGRRTRVRGSEEEDTQNSLSKRQPPAEFVRTQYGNPIEHTFGWTRNASDVLMQAAQDAARKPKDPVAGQQTMGCRVCQVTLQQGMYDTCKRCRRATCMNCLRNCQRCGFYFCGFCSTNNYKQNQTRVFCIDCDLVE